MANYLAQLQYEFSRFWDFWQILCRLRSTDTLTNTKINSRRSRRYTFHTDHWVTQSARSQFSTTVCLLGDCDYQKTTTLWRTFFWKETQVDSYTVAMKTWTWTDVKILLAQTKQKQLVLLPRRRKIPDINTLTDMFGSRMRLYDLSRARRGRCATRLNPDTIVKRSAVPKDRRAQKEGNHFRN